MKVIDRPLVGHVVILVPAAHAHGKSIAVRLGAAGASVALVSLAALRTRVRHVEEAGGRAIALRANLVDPVSVRLATTEIVRELGPPSSLVHIAPDHLPGWPETIDAGTRATIDSLRGGSVVMVLDHATTDVRVPSPLSDLVHARGLSVAAVVATARNTKSIGDLVVAALAAGDAS
jgi:NAD(P)-dependent dehydrogenase (short-subunit alcohol dehydrogenase family)